jgi:hypothetical protein
MERLREHALPRHTRVALMRWRGCQQIAAGNMDQCQQL